MAKPAVYDIKTLIQAGINPKNGMPIRFGSKADLKDNIRKTLRILDEQNAVNRYKWYNLPDGLTGQMLERIIYYKGQAIFFYCELDDTFYFLPFSLNGTIDIYGRYKKVSPLPFNGVASDKDNNSWITALVKECVYEVIDEDEEKASKLLIDGAVILWDYTKQESQTIIPRQILNDTILDMMAEAFPFARTNLIASSGIKGMVVQSGDEVNNVTLASEAMLMAALTGEPWIAIQKGGSNEFQELGDGTALKSEEFLLYMQSLDNYRLSLYGLDSGGIFEKKSHMLESEQQMNAGNVGLVYQDGLTIRQRFCDIVNSIWELGIWCEASETVAGLDRNMDGIIADEQDQTGEFEGEQPNV